LTKRRTVQRFARFIKIVSVISLVLFTVRCAGKVIKDDHLFNVTYYEFESLQPSEFQNKIETLQGIIQKKPAAPDAARAHIQLAFLYSHYRNPSPDYPRALGQLEKYASLDPEGGKQAYVQDRLRMLKEIAAYTVANEDLKGKTEQMKKEIARLDKENTEMKEKLERLKYLDIELEEKRKLVK